jgi:predicted RNase H-like HicB family nuclease
VAGGESLDDVLANLKEAAEGWLLAKQDLETQGWPSP